MSLCSSQDFLPFSSLPLYIMKVSMFNYSVLKGTVISKGQVEFKNSLYRVLHCAAVTKEKENLLIILPDFMGNGIWTIKVIGLISSVLYIAGNKFLLS